MILEYRERILILVLFTLSLQLVGACDDRAAKTGPTSPPSGSVSDKWYTVREIANTAGQEPQEERLSPAEAAKYFEKQFTYLSPGGWTRLSADPNTVVNKVRSRLLSARLTAISKTELVVTVREPLERPPESRNKLWPQQYRVLHVVRVSRTPRVDALFNAPSMWEHFDYSFQGIGYGSSCARSPKSSDDDVRRRLGPTQFSHGYQYPGGFDLYYPEHNLLVVCADGEVYYVEHVTPYWVRELRREESRTPEDEK